MKSLLLLNILPFLSTSIRNSYQICFEDYGQKVRRVDIIKPKNQNINTKNVILIVNHSMLKYKNELQIKAEELKCCFILYEINHQVKNSHDLFYLTLDLITIIQYLGSEVYFMALFDQCGLIILYLFTIEMFFGKESDYDHFTKTYFSFVKNTMIYELLKRSKYFFPKHTFLISPTSDYTFEIFENTCTPFIRNGLTSTFIEYVIATFRCIRNRKSLIEIIAGQRDNLDMFYTSAHAFFCDTQMYTGEVTDEILSLDDIWEDIRTKIQNQ